MKSFKVERRIMFVTIQVPVKVGELTLDTEHQLCISEGKDGKNECDIDYIDHENAIYMGMEVKDLNTLIEFHKGLGINLNKLIETQFNLVLENNPEIEEFIQSIKL